MAFCCPDYWRICVFSFLPPLNSETQSHNFGGVLVILLISFSEDRAQKGLPYCTFFTTRTVRSRPFNTTQSRFGPYSPGQLRIFVQKASDPLHSSPPALLVLFLTRSARSKKHVTSFHNGSRLLYSGSCSSLFRLCPQLHRLYFSSLPPSSRHHPYALSRTGA